MDPRHYPELSEGAHLSCFHMVSAVNQVKCIDPSLILRGMGCMQHEEGICPVGGYPAGSCAHMLSRPKGRFPAAHFPGPGPVKGGKGIGAGIQIQHQAHEPLHRHRFFTVIGQYRGPGDHIAVRKDRVV